MPPGPTWSSELNSVPEIGKRGKHLPHIFSFLTCIFSSDGKREQKLRLAMEEKKRSRPRKRYGSWPFLGLTSCLLLTSRTRLALLYLSFGIQKINPLLPHF